MKYSSFNWWKHRGKRGWIIGPFFGYQLSIVLEAKRRCDAELGEGIPGHMHQCLFMSEHIGNDHQCECGRTWYALFNWASP